MKIDVKHGCGKKQAVDHIEQAADAVCHGTGIFLFYGAFKKRFNQITCGAKEREEDGEDESMHETKAQASDISITDEQPKDVCEETEEDASGETFPAFFGGDGCGEFVSSKATANKIASGI